MLYCIIEISSGEIYGRCKTFSKALEYYVNFFQCDSNLRIVKMTKEEYLFYTKEILKNS